jgi:hypothetical protein
VPCADGSGCGVNVCVRFPTTSCTQPPCGQCVFPPAQCP